MSPAATPRLLAAPSPGPPTRGAPPASPKAPRPAPKRGQRNLTGSPPPPCACLWPSLATEGKRWPQRVANHGATSTGLRPWCVCSCPHMAPGSQGAPQAPRAPPRGSLPAPSPRRAPATRFFSLGNLRGPRFGAGCCFSRLEKPRFTYFGMLLVLNFGESLCNQRSLPAGPGEAESDRGRGHGAGSTSLRAVCRGRGLGELQNPSGEPGASKASCPAPWGRSLLIGLPSSRAAPSRSRIRARPRISSPDYKEERG